jgi:hypothetical protein
MNKTNSSYVTKISPIAAPGGLLFGYDTAVINGSVGFLEKHFPPGANIVAMLDAVRDYNKAGG